MSTMKIQTGDNVKITSGNYKGTVGVVTKVIKKTRKNGLVVLRGSVSTVPKIVKFRKKQSFQDQTYPGSKFEVDRTIDLSNMMLVTADGKVSKSKIVREGDKKIRVLKVNNQPVVKLPYTKKEKEIKEKAN